jgi:hypothetical protein
VLTFLTLTTVQMASSLTPTEIEQTNKWPEFIVLRLNDNVEAFALPAKTRDVRFAPLLS